MKRAYYIEGIVYDLPMVLIDFLGLWSSSHETTTVISKNGSVRTWVRNASRLVSAVAGERELEVRSAAADGNYKS